MCYNHQKKVNVDTTVQEKNVTFPTDAKLYQKARTELVKAAREHGVELRQSFSRLGKRALRKQSSYSHARQMKRAKKELKKLKIYLGRVIRDVERKCAKPGNPLSELLSRAKSRVGLIKRSESAVYLRKHKYEV